MSLIVEVEIVFPSHTSIENNITTYSAGESFTVSKGDIVKNLSGDANITTETDSETGITTVTVNSG